LKDRRFAIPSAIYWMQMMLSSGLVYSLAFFISTRPGGSASHFGMVTVLFFVCTILASSISRRMIDHIVPRLTATLSLLGSLGSVVLFSQLQTTASLTWVLVLVGFLGLMMGANVPALMKLALGAIPAHKAGAGSGLFSMLRDMGLPTGSSFSLAIFGLSSAYHTRRVTEQTATDLGLNTAQTAELLQAASQRGSEIGASLSAALAESGAGVEQV